MLDRVTETIAFFIGLFKTIEEESRARETHSGFRNKAEKEIEEKDIEADQVKTKESYVQGDFTPDMKWRPPSDEVVEKRFVNEIDYKPLPPASLPIELSEPSPALFFGITPESWTWEAFNVVPAPPPYLPGSIALVSAQTTRLLDTDILIDEDLDPGFPAYFDTGSGLLALHEMAKPFAFHDDLKPPANEDAIGDLGDDFVATTELLKDDTALASGLPEGTSILHGADIINSVITNGQSEQEVSEGTQEPDSAQGHEGGALQAAESTPSEGPSHEIISGENSAVNATYIVGAGISTSVEMVVGDYFELDLIIQYNIASDNDYFTSNWATAAKTGATEAVNKALIARGDNPAATNATDDGTPDFPEAWTVNRLDGNLVLFNWVHQTNHVIDDDVVTATASATETYISTGENFDFNSMTLIEIGFHYDLIIVTGDVYDVNVIEQYNLLYDDDAVLVHADALGDLLSGGGNTLTNSATIINTGNTSFADLTDGMKEGIAEIAGGSDTINSDILSAAANGYQQLNVLYVDGSIFNVNYLKQVNKVSDADQITLLLEGSGNDWEIEAGGNVLSNMATIVDAGFNVAAYVGGETYSDALILQANLIDDKPASSLPGLASEAVLFLSDEMVLSIEPCAEVAPIVAASEGPVSVDVMQTVVA